MVSHRRLLWLTVMLAGLAAAMLYMSGTAAAKTGSTSASSAGNDTSNSATTSTTAPSHSDAGASAQESSETTAAALGKRSATRLSSLTSAISQAKGARSSATQPQSSRRTAETPKPTLRSPAVRPFQINVAASPVAKTNVVDPKPAVESVSVAPPAKPLRQPLTAMAVDVLQRLGTSLRPDPPAVLPRVTPAVAKAQLAALTITQKAPVDTKAVESAPTEATNPLAASVPSATTATAVDGVVVGHSVLTIPCGPGYDVHADWYFPTGPDPPTGMIWLQHGFLAQGPWYKTTAAELAKQTNSIVVTPTITSNFLKCDGCWLNGDPMERAAASMFVDRTALTASASAAAGSPVTLPDKFVLVGHSAGGGFATAVARFLVGTRAINDLAGVVMFDGVALNDSMTTSLAELPASLPVYQIAAPSYIWNNFGSGTAQLEQARPGQFVGFQLAGGSHVDSMRGNPIIDFAAQLLTGFSRPANFQAVETLAGGWIEDMFTGGHHGIYADPGHTIEIGLAIATSLPTPPTWSTPIERLIRNTLLFFEQFLFGGSNHHPAPAQADRIAA